MKISTFAFAVLALGHSLLAEPAMSAPAQDAAPLYAKTPQLIKKRIDRKQCSPSNSDFAYSLYPPFGLDWLSMEKSDFDAGSEIRDLAHRAGAMDGARLAARQHVSS